MSVCEGGAASVSREAAPWRGARLTCVDCLHAGADPVSPSRIPAPPRGGPACVGTITVHDEEDYGLPSDIWSLGVMFHELIFGVCCKPSRPSWDRRLTEALTLSGFDRTHGVLIRTFFNIW